MRKEIGKYFLMKEVSIEEPNIHLGDKVRKVELDIGEVCWAFSLSQYVQEACKNATIINSGMEKRSCKIAKLYS